MTSCNDVDVLVVGNKIKKVAKDIPTTGSYEIDVRQERVKEIPVPLPLEQTYSIKVIDKEGKVQKKNGRCNRHRRGWAYVNPWSE